MDAKPLTLRRKLTWVAAFYFAEGLPFGLVIDNLPVYFRVHGVSLAEIGLLSLLGLPWTLKVLWAPAVDRFGERRHWICASLLVMAVVLLLLPFLDPATPTLWLAALLMVLTTASATQDIAIDAFTIGLLAPGEEGVANGVRVSAYRVALVFTGGVLVALAGTLGWFFVFHASAGLMLLLAAVAWNSPSVRAAAPGSERAFFAPLWAWLRRPHAWAVLLFVLLYKLGDAAMGPMVKPFWLDRGLSVEEVGIVSTSFGVAASVAGAMAGGLFTSRYGMLRGLIVLGLLQAVSNVGYATVAFVDAGRWAIYAASLFESFTGGLGTAAFLAFLMHICDPDQAATEYALLSALFGLTRTIAGSMSGVAATSLGYAPFFLVTFLLALPAYALLPQVRFWIREPVRD